MRLIDIEPFEKQKDVRRCQIYQYISGDGYSSAQTTDTESIPTIKAEPVRHGRWEEKTWWQKKNGKANGYTVMECSICGCHVKPKYTYNYCPNCGARMDGESE